LEASLDSIKRSNAKEEWKEIKSGRSKALKTVQSLEETSEKSKLINPTKDPKQFAKSQEKLQKKKAAWNSDCHALFSVCFLVH
jgi:hypothetical protein